MALAGSAYRIVHAARLLLGKSDEAEVVRAGFKWALDLREGLDLAIYLTGYFQRAVVQSCLAKLPEGAIALDIGANMGAFTLHMANAVGPHGKVIAIEPTCYPYQRLCRNLRSNPSLTGQVSTLQAFLTANPNESIPEALPSSWRLAGERKGAHPVHFGVPQATGGSRSLTLDQLAKEIDLQRLDLVKIDVDGAEDDVLAGGEKVLRQFKPDIIIEVAPYTLVERNLAPDAPLERLKKMGYCFQSLDGRKLDSTEIEGLMKLRPGQSRDIVASYCDAK